MIGKAKAWLCLHQSHMPMKLISLFLFAVIASAVSVSGQLFGPEILIDQNTLTEAVVPADLDGDGDDDLLVAEVFTDQITWFENLGGGIFGPKQVISNQIDDGRQVAAADLDNDGDLDVISSSVIDHKIAWYENLGSGLWGQQRIITLLATEARGLFSADLNGDQRPDVVYTSEGNSTIEWSENLGSGFFSTPSVITSSFPSSRSVTVSDLDMDGDNDVLATSSANDTVAWFENQGGGTFGPPISLTQTADGASAIAAADLDGDQDLDIIASSVNNSQIFWFKNLLEPDADRDGLSDADEILVGTFVFDQDSDDDGLSDGEEYNILRPDSRWLLGPSGNYYRLSTADTWSGASASARGQGYELTSVQDEAEAIWLSDTFGDVGDGFWIGFNDFLGAYEWSDGSPVVYTRWATGEPGATPAGVYVGGPSSLEPGYWFADSFGASQRLAVWESPGPNAPMTKLDPLAFDTDGDGIGDGAEDRVAFIIWDGSGLPGITGTDPLIFIPDADPARTTDPLNLDSDNDGLADGAEDLDSNGRAGLGETDAALADTDGAVFIPDSDPGTTTDPLEPDSDGGGVDDGIEDQNHNGDIDSFETDPNFTPDESLAFYVSDFQPGQRLRFEVFQAGPSSVLAPVASLTGPGPTALGIGVIVDLSPPMFALTPTLADAQGHRSWTGPLVPANLALGTSVWFQLVEMPFGVGSHRVSNPILLPVGNH